MFPYFKVFARESNEGDHGEGKTSRPVSMTVIIQDVNDNSPVLETIEDIIITAGKKRRKIASVRPQNFLTMYLELYLSIDDES